MKKASKIVRRRICYIRLWAGQPAGWEVHCYEILQKTTKTTTCVMMMTTMTTRPTYRDAEAYALGIDWTDSSSSLYVSAFFEYVKNY
jgi:hypothetical protein